MGHQGPSYEDLYTQNVVINMDDQDDLLRVSLEGKSAKERTIWLRESTLQGAYSSEEMKEGGLDTDSFQERKEGRAGQMIMRRSREHCSFMRRRPPLPQQAQWGQLLL